MPFAPFGCAPIAFQTSPDRYDAGEITRATSSGSRRMRFATRWAAAATRPCTRADHVLRHRAGLLIGEQRHKLLLRVPELSASSPAARRRRRRPHRPSQ